MGDINDHDLRHFNATHAGDGITIDVYPSGAMLIQTGYNLGTPDERWTSIELPPRKAKKLRSFLDQYAKDGE